MNTKHTPGPWTVSQPSGAYPWEAFVITATIAPAVTHTESGYPVNGRPVTVARIQRDAAKSTADANAKLIAAAPDLLAALDRLLSVCEYYPPSGAVGEAAKRIKERLEAAREAIANATK